MSSPDVLVLGLGAMGLAASRALAARGARVLGFDSFSLAHDRGSSHGHTRVIRQAYFEHPSYVPLLRDAYRLWDELGTEHGHRFFQRTGVFMTGPKDGGMVLPGVRESARQYAIAVEELSRRQAAERFPQFVVPDGYDVLFEPNAGYLELEPSLRALANSAEKHGAVLCFGESVRSWSSTPGEAQVVMTSGTIHRASRLVITAGPWSAAVLHDLALPLRVHRIPQFWFEADDRYAENSPCFFFDLPQGFMYGFPRLGPQGMKIAEHTPRQVMDGPEQLDRQTHDSDLVLLEPFIKAHLPGVRPRPLSAAVCMYTMTPDENFVIDRHPRHPEVSFAAGFSGHGYKFAPVVGECLADLALTGTTRFPIDFLRRRWERK